jgi:hypothetical protein
MDDINRERRHQYTLYVLDYRRASAKKVASASNQSFQAPLQAPVHLPPSLRPNLTPASAPSKKVSLQLSLLPPTFLAQRIATKHTHRAPLGVSLPPLWEKVPGQRSSRSHFQQRTAIEAAASTTDLRHLLASLYPFALSSRRVLEAMGGGAGTG